MGFGNRVATPFWTRSHLWTVFIHITDSFAERYPSPCCTTALYIMVREGSCPKHEHLRTAV